MARSNLLDGFAYGVINEILGTFRTQDGGYAKPSRYEVIIAPPPGYSAKVKGGPKDVVRKTSLEMAAVAFPGVQLQAEEDTNIYGPPRKIVRGQTFAEIVTQIRCSADMKEKNFIDTWQRLAAPRTDFSVGYYSDYVGTMQIFQLDHEDKRRYGVELVECYPITMAEQSLDYSTQNAISFLNVTWSYRYWKNLTDEAELPKPLLDRIGEVFVNTVERNIRRQLPAVLRKL
jgi:hypothetical protein